LHVLPRWRGRIIDSITKRDVLDVLDRVVAAGKPVAANRTFAVVRKLFNWCVARDIVAASPCIAVKRPAKEQTRDRVLSDDELRHVWRAADQVGAPLGSLVKLLILTGQRRDEVARMSWLELDLENKLLRLPRERVKNNRAHDVPLSPQALSVIEALPRFVESPHVLTTNGNVPTRNYNWGMRRLRSKLPPMPPWTLHDLRRTCASGMARLGIALPVIEKVLNHASGSFAGIVGVYQRHDFAEEKRKALEAWGRHISGLVGR
jgi:integrase